MALTKDQKKEVVDEFSELLSSSKMTVVAKYQGTTVKAMQELRHQARASGTKVKVAKNRLIIKALKGSDSLKDVAPAQSLNKFAKTNPNITFVGAITAEGKFIGADDVKALAGLPGKNELVAQIVATLSSPLNDVVSGLSGNLHALLDGIEAKATS
jgi:large subunit ribosomal protein L10